MNLNNFNPKALTRNSMTLCWIFVLVLLIIGTAGAFELVNWTLSPLTEGLLFLTAGIIMLLESIFEGKKFSLENLSNRPSDVVGIITGVLAILLSIGIFLESSFLITHLSGIKGGLFIFLLVYLLFEGIKNRN